MDTAQITLTHPALAATLCRYALCWDCSHLTRTWPCWARLTWRLTLTRTPASSQATVASSGVGTSEVSSSRPGTMCASTTLASTYSRPTTCADNSS